MARQVIYMARWCERRSRGVASAQEVIWRGADANAGTEVLADGAGKNARRRSQTQSRGAVPRPGKQFTWRWCEHRSRGAVSAPQVILYGAGVNREPRCYSTARQDFEKALRGRIKIPFPAREGF
jgi:hypothetical protein